MVQPASRTTAADRAAADRAALWGRLQRIFRDHRPSGAQLGQVATLAEVAVDQVFDSYQFTAAEREELFGSVKDYAECAGLYGFVLGYWQARNDAIAAGLPPVADQLAD